MFSIFNLILEYSRLGEITHNMRVKALYVLSCNQGLTNEYGLNGQYFAKSTLYFNSFKFLLQRDIDALQ